MNVLNFIGGTLPIWAGLALVYLTVKETTHDNR